MEEFERMWKQDAGSSNHPPPPPHDDQTPEYQIRDGIARLSILADILLYYFHSKHGVSMAEVFEEPKKIEFNL